MKRLLVLAATGVLLTAACTQGDDSDGEGAGLPAANPVSRGTGVTEDTIRIGYTFSDIEALREQGVADVNQGPHAEHIQVLVDDLNTNGGIHGRSLEVIPVPIDLVNRRIG